MNPPTRHSVGAFVRLHVVFDGIKTLQITSCFSNLPIGGAYAYLIPWMPFDSTDAYRCQCDPGHWKKVFWYSKIRL
jgi:hypothetical protein